jgi:hypothetical protein
MEGTHERAETVFGFPVCSQRGGGQEGNGREWGRGEGEGGGRGKVFILSAGEERLGQWWLERQRQSRSASLLSPAAS